MPKFRVTFDFPVWVDVEAEDAEAAEELANDTYPLLSTIEEAIAAAPFEASVGWAYDDVDVTPLTDDGEPIFNMGSGS